MKYLIGIVFIFISGCTTTHKSQDMIGYNCPKIVLPETPVLPIYALGQTSNYSNVVKTYVVSTKLLLDWVRIVKSQVESS